jgi:hypothetical protein
MTKVSREVCSECNRFIANEDDESDHNIGECGCKESRALCWRTWNGNESIYDTLKDEEYGDKEIE